VDLPRPEGHVDERELPEELVLDRLRPAAADADDDLAAGPALVRGGFAQMGDEALVGLLADRAGVEEDEVRAGALRCLAVAERARSSDTRRW
jgi:hypothetical protein